MLRLLCAFAGFIATARAQLAPSVDAHAPPAPTGAVQAYASLPMAFEANQGQTDPRVKFLSRGPGYTLFLTQKEAVLSLLQPEKNPRQTRVVRLKFAGSKSATPIAGRDLLRAKSNYFLGKDPLQWHTNVPNYAGAAYQGIYPGVDAVFHGNGKHLEFDFEVAPGANPGAIGIEIQGSKRLHFNSQGDIVLSVGSAAEVVLEKPRVYQEVEGHRREIAGKFALRGPHRLGFRVGRYDHSLPLVIDPTLAYSTYIGGNSVDQVNGVAVGPSSKAYIVGTTNSSNFPTFSTASSGAYQSTCYACAFVSVAFVAELDPTQSGASSLIYSTFVGPQGPSSVMPDLLGSSTGNAIVVDPSGDAYITGQANSNYFPATPTKNASSCGAFVAELDLNGANLLGSACVGSSSDQGNAIAQDSLLNIYVGGTTGTSDLAVPGATAVPPAVQTALNGSHTPFVAKFSPGLGSTSLQYFTYLGGSVLDAGLALAVDAAGEAYLGGVTYSTTFPTSSNQSGTNTGGNGYGQGFLAKISNDATKLLFVGFLGGTLGSTNATSINAVALDASGNAYVTGSTSETDLQPADNPPVAGPNCQTVGTTCPESFVAEFNPNATTGQLVFVSYFGGFTLPHGASGIAPSKGNGIALDEFGDIFITGVTGANDFPDPDVSPNTSGGFIAELPCAPLTTQCSAGFLVEFSPNATAINYATYLGGTGSPPVGSGSAQDQAKAIALDSSDNVYLAGMENSADFPTTPNGFMQASPAFGFHGFFSMVDMSSGQPMISISPSSLNFGNVTVGHAAMMPITVSNPGQAALQFGIQAVPPTFSADASQCPAGAGTLSYSLAAGANCTITTTFLPTTPGPNPGYLMFTDNVPNIGTVSLGGNTQTYTLTGVGVGPTLSSITVTPANPSIVAGATQQFIATGNFSDSSALDLTGSATWTSSITAVATIGVSGGLAQGVTTGTSTITASFGTVSGVTMLTVMPAILGPAIVTDTETITVTDTPSFPDIEGIKVMDTPTVIAFSPLALSPQTIPGATVGTTYGPFQFSATGGVGTITITETGALPAGISFSTAGSLSGAATAAGSFPITITATDSIGNMATENLTLVVAAATLGPAMVTDTEMITVTDTPSFPDVEKIKVTDTPTVIAFSPLAFTTTAIPSATVGLPYNVQLLTAGGVVPVTVTETGPLPAGISLSIGGLLSGPPTVTGSFPITVTATDSIGNMATENLTLVVAAATLAPAVVMDTETITVTDTPSFPDVEKIKVTDTPTVIAFSPLAFTTTSISSAFVGVAYNAQLLTMGGFGTISFTETGQLPAGISLSIGGLLSGTPTATGSFPITVTAKDSIGNMARENLTLVVNSVKVPLVVGLSEAAAATAIQGAGLVVGAVTTAYSNTISLGNVISESPVAGTQVGAGSVVSLVLSNELLINEPIGVTDTPSPSDIPVSEPIKVTDTVSTTVNFNGNLTIASGQTYTFVNGTVTGNVMMAGGALVLNNTTVSGNLQMSGGSLLLTNNSTVQGDIQINGGGTFSIDASHIGGDLEIQNIPAGTAQNQVCGTTANGNVLFQKNGTAALIGSSPSCLGNTVGGNLQVMNNSAATQIDNNTVTGNLQVTNNSAATQIDGNKVAGDLQVVSNTASTAVFSNTVKANLQCSGNNSSLITGGGNTAASKQGQCAGF